MAPKGNDGSEVVVANDGTGGLYVVSGNGTPSQNASW